MPAVVRVGDRDSDGDTQIEGSATVFAGDAVGAPTFGKVPITLPVEYNLEFVRGNINQVSRYGEFDDPPSVPLTPSNYPQDIPPSSFDGDTKEQDPMANNAKDTPDLGDCREIDLPIDYNIKLSPNYTIGNLSTGALFGHSIRAQKGFSEAGIVCNLEALANEILEKVREEYGSFRINSGFRPGSGTSYHMRGMAVDIQEPSWSNKRHFEVAKWIRDNLAFAELILEHGNSCWVHVAFDRTVEQQPGKILTMLSGRFESGLVLYY